MACSFNLRETLLPGSANGGFWTQIGFNNSSSSGPFGPGGSTLPLGGDNPLINPTNYSSGFYQLSYEDGCNPPQIVLLWIQDSPTAGAGQTGNYCINDTDLINLMDLALFGDTGGVWTIAPGSDPVPGGVFDSVTGTFSIPALAGQSGTFKFNYFITIDISDSNFNYIYCATCESLTQVTIVVAPACDPGESNEILIPYSNGNFNLHEFLNGTPDITGTWTQLSGATTSISGGYLGTVNLDSLTGCDFVFKYSCGSGDCAGEATIIVHRDPDFDLEITRSANQLTAVHNPCSGITYQWFKNDGSGYVNTGLTTKTITVLSGDTADYKVIINCNACVQEAIYRYVLECDNDPCFSFVYDEGTDCVTLVNTGTSNSTISSQTIQWKKDGSSYTNYTGPICGCNLREFLDVVPYCSISGGNVRVGYSSFTACPTRTISKVEWEFGDGATGSASGALSNYWLQYTPAQWIAFGRSITFHIHVVTPIGTLIKRVKFVYNGTNQVSCSNITITHENYPKLYYKIWGKRVVNYTDGCPAVTCESFYQKDNGCYLAVLLKDCNVSSDAAICAEYTNCQGTPTFVWKKNGVVLSGETNSYILKATYGFGTYEVSVTCSDCTATDLYIYQAPCSANVTITLAGGILTATPTGCTGGITYQWYKDSVLITGATSNTYTPTANGVYSVTIVCSGCTATASYPFTLPCTVTVNITQASGILTATVTNCTGSRIYTWSKWNGTSWVVVQTATNSSNTNTYTPTQSGLYKVNVQCNNGCTATDQENFVLPCDATVNIAVTGTGASVTLTANATGCGANPVTYLWERWNGTSWIFFASTQAILVSIPSPYRVTISCGGCDAQATYVFTGCTNSVMITVAGSTLTAVPSGCSGPATYQWAISTNGGTTWTNLGTNVTQNASQTGLYRVTMVCDNCTAIDTENYTQPCNTTLTLSFNSATDIITAVTSGCTGTETIQWQYSSTGSGWTNIASGVYSIVATASGFYRAITMCNGACPLARDIEIEIADDCDGITMVINPSIGKVSWDLLKKNGVALTNYLISWRTHPGGVELFKSAKGSYYSPGSTYPHPSSNVPMPVGTYKPFILNSDEGNNLDCLPQFNVSAVQCNDNYELNYDGPGGVAASHSVSLSVSGATGFIKLGFRTYTVADKLQVIYNGSTIFDSGDVATMTWKMYVVPLTFVSGQNYATIKVTNSTPAQNTTFDLKIGCCNPKTTCPVNLNLNTVNAVLNNSCGCDFQIGHTWTNFEALYNALCLNVSDYFYSNGTTAGGCGVQIVSQDNSCSDCATITIAKPVGAAGFIMDFPVACNARYLSLKARLQAITNPKDYVQMTVKNTTCASDGTQLTFRCFPLIGTITFNDASRRISYTISNTNPFLDNCSLCDKFGFNVFANTYATLNNPSSIIFGNFLAFTNDTTLKVIPLATNPYTWSEQLVSECGTVTRRYRISYRNSACPCQSWQMHEDTNNDGTYETLRSEAAGWGGSCV